MEHEIIKVNFNEKIVTMKVAEFDTDIDMDDVLKIDYGNIIGEVLTFPVIVNRVGILRAELENKVNNEKFEIEIYGAKLSEMFRKNAASNGDKVTEKKLDSMVLLDEGYQMRKKRLYRFQKEYDYVDSLYWAAKDKSKKLDYCSAGIKPEDFEREIVSGAINGVMIKVHEKLIK